MHTYTITQVLAAFQTGASNVEAHHALLNELNVFPAYDHDSGTNWVTTLQAFETVDSNQKEAEQLAALSSALVRHARGAVGLLFSAFFVGLVRALPQEEVLDAAGLAKWMRSGTIAAYKAVDRPREGSILSMMKCFGQCLERCSTPQEVLPCCANELEASQNALRNVTHSVDAGALGFYYFIEGFWTHLHAIEVLPALEIIPTLEEGGDLEYRYSCECLCENTRLSVDNIVLTLRPYAGMIMVVVTQNQAKIHFYTNQPIKAFQVLRQNGRVQYPVVEDMQLQVTPHRHTKASFALVCDSAADLPEEWKSKYHIHTLYLPLELEEGTHLDKGTLDVSHFQSLSNQTLKNSGQEYALQWEHELRYLLDHYPSVLYVSLSSKMHPLLKQVVHRMEAQEQNKRLVVLDSQSHSIAQGLLVLQLAKAMAKGNSIEEVVRYGQTLIQNRAMAMAAHELHHVEKGGKITVHHLRALKSLHLRPLLGVNDLGERMVLKACMSHRSLQKQLVRFANKVQTKDQYAIVYTQYSPLVDQYIRRLKQQTGKEPLYVVQSGVSTLLHAGDAMIGIAITHG